MKTNTSFILVLISAAFILFVTTACGPAALEAKRTADLCNASYGFGTPRATSCINPGYEVIAIASIGNTKGL